MSVSREGECSCFTLCLAAQTCVHVYIHTQTYMFSDRPTSTYTTGPAISCLVDFYRGHARTRSWAMAAHRFQRAVSFGYLAQLTCGPGLRGTVRPCLVCRELWVDSGGEKHTQPEDSARGFTGQSTVRHVLQHFLHPPAGRRQSLWCLQERKPSCSPREVKHWVIALCPSPAGFQECLCLQGKGQAWSSSLLHFEEHHVLRLRRRPPKCFRQGGDLFESNINRQNFFLIQGRKKRNILAVSQTT